MKFLVRSINNLIAYKIGAHNFRVFKCIVLNKNRQIDSELLVFVRRVQKNNQIEQFKIKPADISREKERDRD